MIRILQGDCRDLLKTLPSESVHCVVTSPPYWGLRDYGVAGQLGLESSAEAYVVAMVAVFREVRRVLRKDGTLWLNLGDSYCSQGGLHDGRGDNQPGVGAKEIWHNGNGRADGIVDSRGQRNRNGVFAAGLKPKDLVGIPWRVAFALQADGWWLRQDIIWSKPNPMPESVTDRCTKAHEYIFLLSKAERYYYDADKIREPHCQITQMAVDRYKDDPEIAAARKIGNIGSAPDRKDSSKLLRIDNNAFANPAGRNKRSVWEVATAPFSEAHFATFPPALIEPCILAGCPVGGTVLDPFGGAGTTGLVADRLGRDAILIELNPQYVAMAERRIVDDAPLFADVQT